MPRLVENIAEARKRNYLVFALVEKMTCSVYGCDRMRLDSVSPCVLTENVKLKQEYISVL